MVSGSKVKAEREALSTVLAQQNLIAAMDKQKEASDSTNKSLRKELDELQKQHKSVVQELLNWKARALLAEENTASSSSSADSASRVAQRDDFLGGIDSVGEHKAQVEEEDQGVTNASTRRAVQDEMDRYLAMVKNTKTESVRMLIDTNSPRPSISSSSSSSSSSPSPSSFPVDAPLDPTSAFDASRVNAQGLLEQAQVRFEWSSSLRRTRY